ncbi:MAG: NADH-quinone oxidoreductase subunit N [Nibricoccus sp.]
MNPEELTRIAESNQWLAIVPEISLGCLALALLVLEMLLPKKEHGAIPATCLAGLLGALAGLFINYRTPFLDQAIFGGMLRLSATGQFMRVFFLLTAILVTWLGMAAFKKQKLPRVEFFHIVLVVTAAMMLLAQSNDFVMFFVALETITVGFYVLVSYFRNNALSLEAGLKYLITGALSSGIMLFGIVLLYGVAGNKGLPGASSISMNFGALQAFLEANPNNFIASVGIVLVLSGVAFKIGAVPFQIWIPDVYQGAPTPVTALLAVGSKAAGFAILMVLTQVFGAYQNLVESLLALLAAVTIILGNLGALTQHNVKRLMGLSGVSHAGYLLLGVIAANSIPQAADAVNFYLVVYLFASFAVFGVMTHLAGPNDADQEMEHYTDLARRHPFYAAVLAIGLGSLAGIPPLAGFIGKLLIFIAAFKAGLFWLLAVAILGVVVSIYYYFGWIKAAYFSPRKLNSAEAPVEPDTAEAAPINVATVAVLALLAFASVLLGFFQTPLTAWIAKL